MHRVVLFALPALHNHLLPQPARRMLMSGEKIELTAEMLAKREARRQKRAVQQTPEAVAAAQMAAAAEMEAKRDVRTLASVSTGGAKVRRDSFWE